MSTKLNGLTVDLIFVVYHAVSNEDVPSAKIHYKTREGAEKFMREFTGFFNEHFEPTFQDTWENRKGEILTLRTVQLRE